MKLGTKSLLWGAHAFFLHPFMVARGWWHLWGAPRDPKLWMCFLLHDIGYLGQLEMDGEGSENHVRLGAEIVRWLCGDRYADECYRHSRLWCRLNGLTISRLCLADKMAFVLTPAWLYLPMAKASGELQEYMDRSREQKQLASYSVEELRLIRSDRPVEWLTGLQMFTDRWVQVQIAGDPIVVAQSISRTENQPPTLAAG